MQSNAEYRVYFKYSGEPDILIYYTCDTLEEAECIKRYLEADEDKDSVCVVKL